MHSFVLFRFFHKFEFPKSTLPVPLPSPFGVLKFYLYTQPAQIIQHSSDCLLFARFGWAQKLERLDTICTLHSLRVQHSTQLVLRIVVGDLSWFKHYCQPFMLFPRKYFGARASTSIKSHLLALCFFCGKPSNWWSHLKFRNFFLRAIGDRSAMKSNQGVFGIVLLLSLSTELDGKHLWGEILAGSKELIKRLLVTVSRKGDKMRRISVPLWDMYSLGHCQSRPSARLLLGTHHSSAIHHLRHRIKWANVLKSHS